MLWPVFTPGAPCSFPFPPSGMQASKHAKVTRTAPSMPCAPGWLVIPVFLSQVSLEWSEIKLLPAGRGAPTGRPRKNYQCFKPGIRDCSTALASLSDFLFYVIWEKSFSSNPPLWAQMTYWPFGINGLNKLSANYHFSLIADLGPYFKWWRKGQRIEMLSPAPHATSKFPSDSYLSVHVT